MTLYLGYVVKVNVDPYALQNFWGSILDHEFKCSKYILADKNSKFIFFNLHFVSNYNLMQLLLLYFLIWLYFNGGNIYFEYELMIN